MSKEATHTAMQQPVAMANAFTQKNELKEKKTQEQIKNSFISIQPKLTVGAPDDPYEKEADVVADKVMRMPDQNFVQRKCTHCEEEERQQLHRTPLNENITPFVQTKNENTFIQTGKRPDVKAFATGKTIIMRQEGETETPTTDHLDTFAAGSQAILNQINPYSYCRLNCPATADAFENFVRTGEIDEAHCDRDAEFRGTLGYDVRGHFSGRRTITSENETERQRHLNNFIRLTRRLLSHHGDVMVVEAERTESQQTGRHGRLSQYHYFVIVRIREAIFVVDAYQRTVRPLSEFGAYLNDLNVTYLRYTTRDFTATPVGESVIRRKHTDEGSTNLFKENMDMIGGRLNSSKGSGSSMDTKTHSFMSSRFSADFSNVKIHANNEAAQLSKELKAKAFTTGSDIYFNEGQYQPQSSQGKHLLAHELTHVVQQNNGAVSLIQAKRELDITNDDEKKQYEKCLKKIEEVIGKLESNATKAGMPSDIKEAIELLRKKFTEKKIKCYYLDGLEGGETDFTTGEIYMDAKVLKDSPGEFANIGEGNVLHEGIHSLHAKKFPKATGKYGKALDEQRAGKEVKGTEAEEQEFKKLKAWTEYWAYRGMKEYNNVKSAGGQTDEAIHNETMKDSRVKSPIMKVWAFDPKFDPRTWNPKN